MAENLLLDVLPDSEKKRIAPICERVPLDARATLSHTDEPPAYAWFPLSGVCSMLLHADNGEAVEVGLVGHEGMIGLPLVLGEAANPFHALVQVPGTAVRIARDAFINEALRPGRPFCDALLKYANLYLATIAQTSLCNRLHRIEQRLARWLLDMRDRTGAKTLPLTHELLGLMLGAYRPSITNALGSFQNRGVVRIGRGVVEIVDSELLEMEACECYGVVARRTTETLNQIRSLAA